MVGTAEPLIQPGTLDILVAKLRKLPAVSYFRGRQFAWIPPGKSICNVDVWLKPSVLEFRGVWINVRVPPIVFMRNVDNVDYCNAFMIPLCPSIGLNHFMIYPLSLWLCIVRQTQFERIASLHFDNIRLLPPVYSQYSPSFWRSFGILFISTPFFSCVHRSEWLFMRRS